MDNSFLFYPRLSTAPPNMSSCRPIHSQITVKSLPLATPLVSRTLPPTIYPIPFQWPVLPTNRLTAPDADPFPSSPSLLRSKYCCIEDLYRLCTRAVSSHIQVSVDATHRTNTELFNLILLLFGRFFFCRASKFTKISWLNFMTLILNFSY